MCTAEIIWLTFNITFLKAQSYLVMAVIPPFLDQLPPPFWDNLPFLKI